jgi:hypothetical protein
VSYLARYGVTRMHWCLHVICNLHVLVVKRCVKRFLIFVTCHQKSCRRFKTMAFADNCERKRI